MNTRNLALAALLVLGLSLLAWFFGSGDGQGRSATAPEGAELAASGPEAPQVLEAPEDEAVLAEVDSPEPSQARRAVSQEAEAAAARSWPAAETRWVELRLNRPEGTPRDEQAQVLALVEGGDYSRLYGADGPVVALRAGQEPRRIEGLLAAAPFDAQGTARLGLAPDTQEAWLVVAGSYLYSLEPRRIELDALAGPVELRPVLGAWISGQLRAPPGTPPADLAGVQIELDWAINAALQLGAAGAGDLDLKTRSDDQGRFEFRAVPTGKPQTITTENSVLARSFSDDLQPAAGEHLELRIDLLRGGTVRGRVVDEAGAPLAGVEVQALGREFFGNPTDGLRERDSDAEGRFEIPGLTPGKVWLRLRHEGYQDLLTPFFELADGEQREHGDVVLVTGPVLAGTVRFPDGRAAAGTRLGVEPDLSDNLAGNVVDPRAYIGARNQATADEHGAFRITGLGSGPWVVTARLEVEGPPEDPATGAWNASREHVRAPAEDLQLTLEPPVSVSGTVLDASEQPVGPFQVLGERAGSQWYMPPSETRKGQFESPDGSFRLADLRAGAWTFHAEAEGYARSEEVQLELPSDEALTLVLLRPLRLGGTVVDPEGRPVAGAEVSKELEGTEVFEAMQGRGDWPVARSDDEGVFLLEGVAPGIGSIVAKKDGFAPSEPVALELGPGEQKLDLVLTLRRGGTITGEVYDAEGDRAAGSMVILQMPTLSDRRFASTDARGEFRETGLKPGRWQVQAFPGIASLQSESGEALDQQTLLAALKMAVVEVTDEAEEHVVLGAPPAAPVRVHGEVTLDGKALGELLISFVPASADGLSSLKIDTLGADGRYELQLDEPGDYLVTVQSTNSPGRQNSIEFRRSIPQVAEFELDFALPLGRVSGRVRNARGDAVPEARVTLTMQGGLVFGTVFGGHYTETVTDAEGAYDIPFLRPGSYTVAAGGSPLGGLFGSGSPLGRVVQEVAVGEDEWIRGVDFRLEEPGKIQGTVRDASGKPAAEASIFVRDASGRLLELFSLAQTNATGAFEYAGLAPGEYTLSARTRTLASASPVPVRVRSGESTSATVVLEPGTVLLVSLEDRSGADIPARISVLDARGREVNGMLGLPEIMERYSGGLDAAVQRVGPLPPGAYEVRAVAEDGRSTSRPVNLSGQEERRLKLRLK